MYELVAQNKPQQLVHTDYQQCHVAQASASLILRPFKWILKKYAKEKKKTETREVERGGKGSGDWAYLCLELWNVEGVVYHPNINSITA